MRDRPVYLDRNSSLTAAQLKTVGDCQNWISVLQDRIRRIEDQDLPGHRPKAALHYARRALYQVNARLDDLQ